MSDTVDPTTNPPLTPEIIAACEHCAAGHRPRWQPHSREWVHSTSPLVGNGRQFTITMCKANRIRKGMGA